jgi:hypothetical protein
MRGNYRAFLQRLPKNLPCGLISTRPNLFAFAQQPELCSQSVGGGEDGTEVSPFAFVLGPAGAERCQAGHVALPALLLPRQYPVNALSGVLGETSQKIQWRRALSKFVL